MSKLIEKRNEYEAKAKLLNDIFEQAKTGGKDLNFSKITLIDGTDEEKSQKIRAMNDELEILQKEIKNLTDTDEIMQKNIERLKLSEQPGNIGFIQPAADKRAESFGQKVIKSQVCKVKEVEKIIDVETKTLFQRTDGWAPESIRSGVIVDYATRPIQVINVIPQGTITQSVYKYLEEVIFTNAAVEVAENGAYPEAALKLEDKEQTVQKIAVYLPVTDEQLEDETGAQSYIDQRLVFMIQQRLDSQLLNGDGVAPNILGVYNKVGIQTQAKGADPTPDAFYKAMMKVMVVGQANPSSIIMHPYDWQDIRLLRTTGGVYIWGNPSEKGFESMWGLPVVKAQAATENTGIVGDFAMYSLFLTKRGVSVKITDSHEDDFTNGRQCIRADMRGVLVIFRAAAFCTVTGI